MIFITNSIETTLNTTFVSVQTMLRYLLRPQVNLLYDCATMTHTRRSSLHARKTKIKQHIIS